MTTGAVPDAGATVPPVPRAPTPDAPPEPATAPPGGSDDAPARGDEPVSLRVVAPGVEVREAAPPAEPARLVPSLLPAVEVTVERTVARWLALSARAARVDWPRLLVGAIQHRVEGICADALRALTWDELAPPSVVDALDRRALLAESRYLAHYHALQELRDLDEELMASLVVLNGAAVVGDYTSVTHRLIGDVDLWVDAEHAARLGERARRLGYWEKDGARGPTYYRDVANGAPGAAYVGLDVHVGAPTDGLGDGRAAGHWAANLVPHVVGDVKVHRPTPALEVAHLLVRLHEHAGSWARWVAEDDVRLIRILDIEVVAAALDAEGPGGVPGEAVLAHAEALGVISEVAVGAAVVRAVRGALPAALAGLEPYAAAAADCTRLLALPGGDLLAVDEPLIERALCVDKSARTRALAAPADGSAPDWSRGWRRPSAGDDDGLFAIADRAAAALTDAALVGA